MNLKTCIYSSFFILLVASATLQNGSAFRNLSAHNGEINTEKINTIINSSFAIFEDALIPPMVSCAEVFPSVHLLRFFTQWVSDFIAAAQVDEFMCCRQCLLLNIPLATPIYISFRILLI